MAATIALIIAGVAVTLILAAAFTALAMRRQRRRSRITAYYEGGGLVRALMSRWRTGYYLTDDRDRINPS